MELRQTETLAFGNIDRGVGVNQVGGRAVCLAAGDAAVAVCPIGPLGAEVLDQQIRNRLTIVAHDAGRFFVALLGEEGGEVLLEAVTAAACKLLQKVGCPVGSIDLVRVIKEGVGEVGAVLLEGLVEGREVAFYGPLVEVVHHITLATRGGTLHLLQRLADVQHDQFPFAYGGIPTQYPLLDLLRKIKTLTTSVVGHHTAQLCHRALLLVLHLDGERNDAASLHLVAGKESLRGGILCGYVWTAKGPSRAVVHRHLDADTLTLLDGVLQHLHPAFA